MKRWTVRRAVGFERSLWGIKMNWLVIHPDGVIVARYATHKRAVLIAQRYARECRGHAEADQ